MFSIITILYSISLFVSTCFATTHTGRDVRNNERLHMCNVFMNQIYLALCECGGDGEMECINGSLLSLISLFSFELFQDEHKCEYKVNSI